MLTFIKKHKRLFFIALIILIGGGYYFYSSINQKQAATRYAVAAVQKETIVVSITGTGQVSASNQVDIKPKVSGDVLSVAVADGQKVKQGALLATIDARDAQKAVRDAQAGLDSAKLALAKLEEPADQLSALQAENALSSAQESKQNSQDDLIKSYDDGFNTISNAFLDLPSVMSGLNNILFSYDLSQSQENIDYYNDAVKNYDKKVTQYRDDAYNLYQTARAAYDKNFADYKAASRSSDNAAIESLINETYDTTKSIAEAVKSANNLIQFYEDQLTSRNLNPKAVADTHLASLNSYTGKTNTHLLNLLTIENTIQADKQAIINADRTISEKQASIAKLQAGTDALDIQTQELNIKQKENALLDAKEKLADYSIQAPFDGIVSKVDIKKGDSASTGTAVATMITEQQIAEVSLNEVDAAKVKVGQKATLTFDAVDNLSITGKVLEIDTIGTVSQGVVSYTVKIGFDTQDQRVKPGMSVSAAIVTDVKADVLAVPNSAVKSQNGQNYVEILNPDDQIAIAGASQVEAIAAPKQQTIEIGLANDTSTEIVSGLKQGDNVVIQTISPTTTTTTSSSSSGLRIPGLTGGGGGNFRGN